MRPRRLPERLEYGHAGGMADRLKTEALEHSREQGGMLEAIAAALLQGFALGAGPVGFARRRRRAGGSGLAQAVQGTAVCR